MSVKPQTGPQNMITPQIATAKSKIFGDAKLSKQQLFVKSMATTYSTTDDSILIEFNIPKLVGSYNIANVKDSVKIIIEQAILPAYIIADANVIGPRLVYTLIPPITGTVPIQNVSVVPPTPVSSSALPAGPSAIPSSSSPLPAPSLLGLINPIAGLSGPSGTPSVAGTNYSLSSQVSMSSSDIKKALSKVRSNRDVEINEREFRDIIRKHPHIARLARRSSEETFKSAQDASQLRTALQELIELDEIQRATYSTVDGEIPLKIKKPRDIPLSQRRVGRTWVRKPVGL